MRMVLFYSSVESFNYFTNQLARELQLRGHDIFILDLENAQKDGEHSFAEFSEFVSEHVDMALCFDGIGLKEELFIELWNAQNTITINILMDHPLRFHPTMERHPEHYFQFCCDENHVAYVKQYFGEEVPKVFFLPHAGSLPAQSTRIPFGERKYDILFSGTYYRPESYLEQLDKVFPVDSTMNLFYRVMLDRLVSDSRLTTEQAVLDTIQQLGLKVSAAQQKTLFQYAEEMDWCIRMYHRGRVIQTLADAGFEVWLLGRGWEHHPAVTKKNVHRIHDRIPFADTLTYMADAKLNLNVMPWFKAGTHDRIFNILLQHSLPLTDSSAWLEKHFTHKKDILFYDLNHLEELPEMVSRMLASPAEAEEIIENGYNKVSGNYIWKNCVDEIFRCVSE